MPAENRNASTEKADVRATNGVSWHGLTHGPGSNSIAIRDVCHFKEPSLVDSSRPLGSNPRIQPTQSLLPDVEDYGLMANNEACLPRQGENTVIVYLATYLVGVYLPPEGI